MSMRSLGHSVRRRGATWSAILAGMAALVVAGVSSAGAATVNACPTTGTALQTAIQQAGDGGTVAFTCATPTTIPFDPDRGGPGAIALGHSITLDGTGATGGVTFDGGGKVRLFTTAAGTSVTIRRLALDNGFAPPVYRTPGGVADSRGGAILGLGAVRIEDSTFTGNSIDGRLILQNNIMQAPIIAAGGAVYSVGPLTVSGSTFSDNSALKRGGAISAEGQFTVTGSTFTGNASAAGSAINSGSSTITNSTFTDNGDGARGVVSPGGTTTISGSTFTDNGPHAVDIVDGVTTVRNTRISGTWAVGAQGSLYVSDGTLILERSQVTGNSSGSAGAIKIAAGSRAEVRDSILADNTTRSQANGPGAIDNAGTLIVERSTISGNTAVGSGAGAINNTSGLSTAATADIRNSTITGNISQPSNNAGAISMLGGTVKVANSTIAGNRGGVGDGFFVAGRLVLGGDPPSSSLEIYGSIIAGHDKPTCIRSTLPGLGPVMVVDGGYNVVWSGNDTGSTCNLNSGGLGVTGSDPRLSSLADNGGATPTMALRAGSPAVDAVPRSSGLCPAVDQRGVARPVPAGAAACDSGAFEGAPAVESSVFLSASPGSAVFGQPIAFTATVVTQDGFDVPTGTVQFREGTVDLGGPRPLNAEGRAVFETGALGVGQHTVTAHYGGDTIYPANVSNGMIVTVGRAATTTTVSSSANPSVAGEQVTYTATVAPAAPGAGTPGGTVTFMAGSTALGTASVDGSGVASLTVGDLAVGSHSITAAYSGDAQFQASTSAALTQVVNEVPVLGATRTTLRSSVNPSLFGQAVTLIATVAGDGAGTPTGTVTFMVGATSLGAAAVGSGGAAVLRTDALAVGSHAVTAVYAGDERFAASTSTALTQVVTITPAALCSLTQKYVQGSAKYAALGRLQRVLVDVLFRAACTVTAAVTPRLNARQKAAAITAHSRTIDNLVKQGWLTTQQGATLKDLASKL